MSKKIRYAKFPLDCKAFDDANKEAYRAHSDLKPGEKLTMDRKHGRHRETWMNAYIESLKKQGKEPKNYISMERQNKKPGEPVADCKSSKTELKTGTIVVTVLDAAKTKPINEATVLIRGPGSKTATTGYDGKVAFDNVPIGTYNVSGLKDLYADEKQIVKVHRGKQAKVTLRLKSAQKELRKIDFTVIVKGHDYNKKKIYLLSGATVTLRNEKGFDIRQGKSDRNGKVIFTAIQPGRYQLLISRKDYISRKVKTQVVIKHPQVLEVTLRYKWQAITFYLVLNTLDIIVGRKSKGVLYATTEGSRYNWECKCTSIGWTPGGGVGSIDTIGTTIHYDPFVFDLIHYWREKDISLRSAGLWAWIIITDAMPPYSDWEKRPIKEAKFYDPYPGKRHLRIRFKQKDGAGEIGGYTGSGEIRFVKQTIKIIPVIPPLPGRGRQRIEEA